MPFSVGDFLAVAELAAVLYQRVYKVARKAPEEVADLEKDLGLLSQALNILVAEIQDDESLINQSGEDRVKLVVELKDQVSGILRKLQEILKNYDFVRTEDRSKIKLVWDKTKFTKDVSKLRDLRGKLTYYYGLLQLVLTSVNGSSLERLEDNTRSINSNVAEMKKLITSLMGQVGSLTLSERPAKITSVEVEDFQAELAESFISKAEKRGEWRTIGIEDWLQAAKWWLMKSQLAMKALEDSEESDSEETNIPPQAYANLLKASWILTDVLHEHPQRSFVSASQCTVRTLSSNIKAELQKLKSCNIPSKEDILGANLGIWSSQPTTSLHLTSPSRGSVPSRDWNALGNNLLFHKFATYVPETHKRIDIILLVFKNGANGVQQIVGQDAAGMDHFNASLSADAFASEMRPILGTAFDAYEYEISVSFGGLQQWAFLPWSHRCVKLLFQSRSDAINLYQVLSSDEWTPRRVKRRFYGRMIHERGSGRSFL